MIYYISFAVLFKSSCIDKVSCGESQIGSRVERKPCAARTTASGAEIDRMVYELYGLTDDKIRIVEKAVG